MALRTLLRAAVPALLLTAPVTGQAPAPALRLDALYRAVAVQNPRIRSREALAAAADERVAPARRPPDPQLQVGWMNRTLPGLGRDDPLSMDQIQVMQMVPIAGQPGLAGRAARARAAAEHARATETAWEIRARAAMGFYDLYRMDRTLQLMREVLPLLEQLREQAATMYAVGEVRQTDVLRAEVEVARMTEAIVRMEADRIAATAELAALVPGSPDLALGTPRFPALPGELPPLDSLIAEADRGRPMVAAGSAEVRAAAAETRRARREIWPDLQVGLQYGQRPMAGGGTDRMASLMLGVTLPVFAGSRQFAMRREAEAMQAMAEADLVAMRAETRGRVAALGAAEGRARRLTALYRSAVLPQAEAALVSARAAYRTGGVDLMTVLDDQMTLIRYRQELIALEAERGSAFAELEMLLGRELFDPARVADEGATR